MAAAFLNMEINMQKWALCARGGRLLLEFLDDYLFVFVYHVCGWVLGWTELGVDFSPALNNRRTLEMSQKENEKKKKKTLLFHVDYLILRL